MIFFHNCTAIATLRLQVRESTACRRKILDSRARVKPRVPSVQLFHSNWPLATDSRRVLLRRAVPIRSTLPVKEFVCSLCYTTFRCSFSLLLKNNLGWFHSRTGDTAALAAALIHSTAFWVSFSFTVSESFSRDIGISGWSPDSANIHEKFSNIRSDFTGRWTCPANPIPLSPVVQWYRMAAVSITSHEERTCLDVPPRWKMEMVVRCDSLDAFRHRIPVHDETAEYVYIYLHLVKTVLFIQHKRVDILHRMFIENYLDLCAILETWWDWCGSFAVYMKLISHASIFFVNHFRDFFRTNWTKNWFKDLLFNITD